MNSQLTILKKKKKKNNNNNNKKKFLEKFPAFSNPLRSNFHYVEI